MKTLTITSLALAAFITTAATAAPDKWTWKTEDGKSLALHGPDGIVWRLNHGKDLVKFHFDTLKTATGSTGSGAIAAGENTAWVSPPDHQWHYGLWFSWKLINGINYWELAKDGSGYPVGRTMIETVEVLETSQEQARIKLTLTLRPETGAEPVANETALLTIETPRPGGSYAVDWRQSTTALTDLEFGRSSGYGGFSLRAAESWTDPQFLSSNGNLSTFEKPVKVGEPAKWMDLSAMGEKAPAGVTFFDHPSNPRHPTLWFLVNRIMEDKKTGKTWPFFYNNAAIVGAEPLPLPKGETLTLFYRALVHPGRGDAKQLEAEFESFRRLKP